MSFLLVSIGAFVPTALSEINDSNKISNPSIDKIVVTLQTSSYKMTETGNGEIIISMDDFGYLMQPGLPRLPSKIFYPMLIQKFPFIMNYITQIKYRLKISVLPRNSKTFLLYRKTSL